MKPFFNVDAAWAVLVHSAGAPSHHREAFEYHIKHGGQEFRFQGRLGFGGKFWCRDGKVYVTCYPEDETAERKLLIEKVNRALLRTIKGAAPTVEEVT